MQQIPSYLNDITRQIVHASYQVHVELGPGLLESVYEKCLKYELMKSTRLDVKTQVMCPLVYKDLVLDEQLRLDMLIANEVIVEVKAVEAIHPVFEAQLLTYLKLTKKRVGLLINFNVPLIKDGIRRMVL